MEHPGLPDTGLLQGFHFRFPEGGQWVDYRKLIGQQVDRVDYHMMHKRQLNMICLFVIMIFMNDR